MNTRRIHHLLHPKRGEIWMLHRVIEERSAVPSQNVLEVTPAWLESRIKEYHSKGIRFVGIDDVQTAKHFICITLDDGYIDTINVALPLFQRLNVPFTVYVTTGFLDDGAAIPWYPEERLSLTTDEVRRLASERLCTIGAHTISHPHLSSISADAQRFEIETSVHRLESITSQPICHFSYPHGDYNETTVEILKSLGLKTSVTTNGRTVRSDCKPLELDRINVVQPIG